MKTCECGCGQPAPIAKRTNQRYGHVQGQSVRFVRGHHNRVRSEETRRKLAEREIERKARRPGR
jgi:hypothetical protein